MAGGTTFHFVTDGVESARTQALAAADGQDVRLGGGASTIRQFLRAGLVDEIHVAVVPVVLGAGERLFDDVGDLPGCACVDIVTEDGIAHIRLARNA